MRVDRTTFDRYDVPLEEPFATALDPIPERDRVASFERRTDRADVDGSD